MLEIKTRFSLTWYNVERRRMTHPYPSYSIRQGAVAMVDSLGEAESILHQRICNHTENTYCHVISELPIGFKCREDESCSERIYLPNGQLWSVRDYANLRPIVTFPKHSEIELNRDLYGRNLFEGRNPDEIRFKKGDIIEILCHNGNSYWSKNSVELAIVVATPPSKEDMRKRMDDYMYNSHQLTGDRGFDLGTMFNALCDAYTVIPAYLPTDTAPQNLTDYCPTHCAMKPRYEVSPQIQQRLANMLNSYIDHIKHE